MNEADSQEVAFSAAAAGYDIAADPALADVLVLNTCTVRDNAERRAYGRMNHFKLIKDADPGVRLVVMGCLAEQDRERMQQLAPHVDAVFGTKQISELGETLSAWRADFSEGEQPYSDER
ncbi:MAG: tRNA (N6-isopentenyl adenosine(37)-C2)-methylthiotransferase MiaB, partial [Vulcanimicrobiaceae bacterium]